MIKNARFGLPDNPDASPAPAGRGGLPVIPSGSGAGVVSSPAAVTAMQNALIDFAGTMASNKVFGNFFTKRFLNLGLDGVVSALSNLGAPGTMHADGVWKGKTDNALKMLMVVADKLVELSEQMGFKDLPAFDVHDLAELIPADYTKIEDMSATATSLTKEIGALSAYYKQVARLMTNLHGKEMTADAAIANYAAYSSLTPQEAALAKSNAGTVVPGMIVGNHQITIGDLMSIDAFKAVLSKAGIQPTDDNVRAELQALQSSMQGQDIPEVRQ